MVIISLLYLTMALLPHRALFIPPPSILYYPNICLEVSMNSLVWWCTVPARRDALKIEDMAPEATRHTTRPDGILRAKLLF